MQVKDIMTQPVVTVGMDDKLSAIKEIFDHVRFHHVLVMEKTLLMGVISDRDLLKAVSPFINTLGEQTRDLATLNKRAHQIMSRKPVTATTETPVEEAADLMIRNNISCLPVVSESGHLEGVLSWRDILRHLTKGK